MNELEKYFSYFRNNIIGIDKTFSTPFGEKKLIYADWIASGRLYKPIEEKICNLFGPFVGNTHSEASVTGTTMTQAYHEAHKIIKDHVNAGKDDVIITAGSGMTTVVCKFQRLLGLKIPEQLTDYLKLPSELKPMVFITHMEHHSNQTTWLETIADVEVINPNEDGLVDVNDFRVKLEKYKNRKLKIGAFTAASNVTGIEPDYYELSKMIHEYDGYSFIDFACAAPYVKIDMHPADPEAKLDAIFFSPHKFLGGPGTPGVLVFDSKLYHNKVPDMPGGGTVDWTNPWGQHKFVSNIEAREDGGTPSFLQTIKAALCIKLKEEIGIDKIRAREEELVKIALAGLKKIPTLHVLAGNIEHRLGAISFYVENIHYNLIVKLLNDRFGVQVRGGCSCAGTYGHYLLHVDPNRSKIITDKIDQGDLSEKPGWVRMSIHPTMTDDELKTAIAGIELIVTNIDEWSKDYVYDKSKNEFFNKKDNGYELDKIKSWFAISQHEEVSKFQITMYDDNYESCGDTYATFRIFPKEISPDEVTQRLSLVPTKVQRKGDIYKSGYVVKLDGWFLESQNAVNSKDVQRHIDWIIYQLLPKKDILLDLQRIDCSMDIFCFWGSAAGQGGPTLSPSTLRILGDLELEISFDCYFMSGNENIIL